VVVTGRILDQVAFPEEYANVPVWAAAHHELLNGKGYPQHLTAEDLPPEVRLLTILDVFDALTAKDRPYKPGMPVEKALSILHSMVNEGSMDENILALFEQSQAWEVCE
jgi:HD-GYP domain-containing protein (c-di-GMP phosphodiesterase class II)